MRCISTTVILVAVLGASSGVQTNDLNAPEVVQTYCAGCHNGVMRSPSNALLDRFDATGIADNPEIWSRAYRQLQAGTMPPFGAPRPDRVAYGTLLSSIETALGVNIQTASIATDQKIAQRLATLLWNGLPDGELASEARRHRLTQTAALEKQVRRLLADQRAEAFVSRFFFPWLGLDQLGNAEPATKFCPGYHVTLRDAMSTETDLFIRSQLHDDRDPIELWNANYTFLNESLARHYGMTGVSGAQFRRVTLPTPERYGLLGQGSILMITSRHQRGSDIPYTSPAARAIWVRMHFLGAPSPQPFPGARPVKPDLPITPQTRALPAEPCVHCHQNFFPLGYGLEHFDPIGGWRTDDQAGSIDASGALVDGTAFNGSAELRSGFLQYSDAFRTTITERLLMYAAGAPMRGSRPTPGTLVRARQALHAASTERWSSLIAAVVRVNPAEQ